MDADAGEVFGWGNNEYRQLLADSDQTQVNLPQRLPLDGCGHVVKAVAGGSACAVLNSKGVG